MLVLYVMLFRFRLRRGIWFAVNKQQLFTMLVVCVMLFRFRYVGAPGDLLPPMANAQ